MALVINTNLAAMNTHRQLGATDWRLSRSLEKLSSGLRINRASDDAAGLSISEVLRTQVRGNLQAGRNVSDAISLLGVADAGLEEIHAYLQRARELAVQSANGTYTSGDRAAIDQEFQEIMAGINAIAINTSFNGLSLFQGEGGTMTNVNRTTNVTASTTVNSSVTTVTNSFAIAGLTAGTTTGGLSQTAANYNLGVPGSSSIIVDMIDGGGAVTRTLGAGQFTYNAGPNTVSLVGAGMPAAGEVTMRVRYISQNSLTQSVPSGMIPGSEAITLGGVPVANAGGPGGNGYYYNSGTNTVTLVGSARPGASPTGAAQNFRSIATPPGSTTFALNTTNPFTGGAILNSLNINAVPGGALTAGTDYTLSQTMVAQIGPTQLFTYNVTIPNTVLAAFGTGTKNLTATYNIDYPLSVDPLTVDMQIGANNGMTQTVSINPASIGALGLAGANVNTQATAMAALTLIDSAISSISSNRAGLGAAMNQMQGYYNNTTNQAMYMDRSFSAIRDTDMADEMTTFTKQQILSQSSTNMLAMSQNNSQNILNLLSG